LADLHLGYRSPNLYGSTEPEPRDTLLEAIAAYLNPQNAPAGSGAGKTDLLLIAGDLFDSHNPEAALVRRTMNTIKRIQDLGLAVITVPGNHDELSYRDSVYRRYEKEWPGLLVSTPRMEAPMPYAVQGKRIFLVSMAYDARYPTANELQSYFPKRSSEALHICLLHGALWDETSPPVNQRTLLLHREALLESGYDYIALGHLHQPLELQGDNPGCLLAYPGMILQRHAHDPHAGKLLWVEIERGLAPKREWLPCPLPGLEATPTSEEALTDAAILALSQEDTIPGALARCYLRDLVSTNSTVRRKYLLSSLTTAIDAYNANTVS